MTVGEKLREARKKAGLSQEQFAEKLSVSRSAVAKWETDKGMPDVENLQAIAKLLNVSIDYLLDDGNTLDVMEMKEAINLDDYEKTGKCRSKEDAVVAAKYPQAVAIYPLIRQKKMNKKEWILDFIVAPGVLNVADSLNDMSAYYLVEFDDKQLFVNVTKEFIISRELSKRITEKKFVIGQNKFTKAVYSLV